jgi:GH15 family glucan-1,4-alpha-glucosidase
MEAVRRRWREPDHGIWEIRDEPRHHVHSRVMCWATIARGLEILRRTQADVSEWEALRDEIAADILSNGWSEPQQAFVAAYDRDELDASALYVVLMGLLPQDDPRLIATVHAVEAELRVGTTVLRYKYDDGLPGAEGGMTICTSWLVECYLAAGLVEEATELFEQILDAAGETGLLPEQLDPVSGRGMGNHPQAYSHLGVIRCALALDEARRIQGLPQGQLVGYGQGSA